MSSNTGRSMSSTPGSTASPKPMSNRHDFAERREQRILGRVPKTEQVHVARRAVRLVESGGQQHGTLQHGGADVARAIRHRWSAP